MTQAKSGPQKVAAQTKDELPPAVSLGNKIDVATLSDRDLAVLCAEAIGWAPDAGMELEGTVIGVRIGTTERTYTDEKGQEHTVPVQYPIVILLPDGATSTDKATAIHCFHAILQNELMSQRPEPHDRLFVRCLGKGESKVRGRSGAMRYAVHVGKSVTATERSPWDVLARTPSSQRVRDEE